MAVLPARYNLDNLVEVASRPGMVLGEMHRLGNRFNARYHRSKDYDGVSVMAEDWDNLIILDGCRYDHYAEQTPFDGDLDRRLSLGSDSREFLEANFEGETHHDTVYVTANPHAYRLPDGTFHRVVNLLDDHWDPDHETVLPETVSEQALAAHADHPDKRLVVHFMQPHFPFIGETGRELDQGGIVMHRDDADDHRNVWTDMCYGLVDEERTIEAYRENLDLVLDVLGDTLADLPGKTVISADHGNLIGDRLWPVPTRGYGHPRGLHVPTLLSVPWHVLPADERRETRADPPEAVDRPDADVVEDRLQNLGYTA